MADTTEVVQADVLDRESLTSALQDVDTAYYLVHSMGTHGDFEENDRKGAANFAAAAKQAVFAASFTSAVLGIRRRNSLPISVVAMKLGRFCGLQQSQVIEFRASIIIGSGSLSFELIRSLVERLPMMICPRWVATPAQPIAVEDILEYLLAALDLEEGESRVFEIGGPDQVSYGDIMREYARQRGLRRVMISVPVLTPHLSSLWLGLVTPVYARVGRKLIEGVRNPTLVRDTAALDAFDIQPRGLREAIQRALVNEDQQFAETRWSDALSSGSEPQTWGGVRFGSRIVDSRVASVDVTPDVAFAPIQRIGGETGWYYATWLWHIRGWLDLLVGGVGMRRGRRDPVNLRVGDASGLLASGGLSAQRASAAGGRDARSRSRLAGV